MHLIYTFWISDLIYLSNGYPEATSRCCYYEWNEWMKYKYVNLLAYCLVLSKFCSWDSQDKNTEVVCHSLLQWTTFCQNSPPWPICLWWPALHGMAHSFIELDTVVIHVISLISFLWLWFSVCLPSNWATSLVAQMVKHLPAMREIQVGKISWRRKWQPTPVFLPGKSHGRRNLVGYSPWGRKEWEMTEQEAYGSFLMGETDWGGTWVLFWCPGPCSVNL